MSTQQLVASYVEMIPARARGALYFSGVLLPMGVGYLAMRNWVGEPELWLAGAWASFTNSIATAQVVAGVVAKRRRVPPTRDEDGSAHAPDPRQTAIVLAVGVAVVCAVLLLHGGLQR